MKLSKKISPVGIVLLALPLLGATSGHPHSPSVGMSAVKANGTTGLSASIDGIAVSAIIVSRTQIKSKSAKGDVSPCTHSHTPCSLIRQLRLRVGKSDILVPASTVLRLADVSRGSLRRSTTGKFELSLECGDASEAFDAHIIFDAKRVTEIDIIDSEAGARAERTIYFDLSHAFDD